jgi:hypothetical protein
MKPYNISAEAFPLDAGNDYGSGNGHGSGDGSSGGGGGGGGGGGQTNGPTDRLTDRQTDSRTDGRAGVALAVAWQGWRAGLAADAEYERHRWASLGLDFGPGDLGGVWTLEEALAVPNPFDRKDRRLMARLSVRWEAERVRQWRTRMQDPLARAEEETWHRRRRGRRQRADRLRRSQRAHYMELSADCDRRHDAEEDAYIHFMSTWCPAASGLDDRAYGKLLGSTELGDAWEELGREGRRVHYMAVGARSPAWLWVPCDFENTEHHEAFTVLRERRRLPGRGQHRPDLHLPDDYTFGGGGSYGVHAWRRLRRLYGKWAAGGDATALGLTARETDELNELLCDVLRPASAMGMAAGEHDGDGTGAPCAEGEAVFDVRAPPLTRRAMLCDLGWPQGDHPSTPTLTAHVLDRLEYAMAYDVALGCGCASEALHSGSTAAAASESDGEASGADDESDSDAEGRHRGAVATMLEDAGVDTLGFDARARPCHPCDPD